MSNAFELENLEYRMHPNFMYIDYGMYYEALSHVQLVTLYKPKYGPKGFITQGPNFEIEK